MPKGLNPLHSLRYLALDTHCPLGASITPTLWHALLIERASPLRGAPLRSLSLRMAQRLVVSDPFIDSLARAYAPTLNRLALYNCTAANSAFGSVAKNCRQLERLEVPVPIKDVVSTTCLHTVRRGLLSHPSSFSHMHSRIRVRFRRSWILARMSTSIPPRHNLNAITPGC